MRRISENGFGIIANRWRVFRAPILLLPDTVIALILAAQFSEVGLFNDAWKKLNAIFTFSSTNSWIFSDTFKIHFCNGHACVAWLGEILGLIYTAVLLMHISSTYAMEKVHALGILFIKYSQTCIKRTPEDIFMILWHWYVSYLACFPGNIVIRKASCKRFTIKYVKYADK